MWWVTLFIALLYNKLMRVLINCVQVAGGDELAVCEMSIDKTGSNLDRSSEEEKELHLSTRGQKRSGPPHN